MANTRTSGWAARVIISLLALLVVLLLLLGAFAAASQAPAAPTLTATPSNPTNQLSATFAFTSKNATSYQCSLDASAFATCSSPTTYPSLFAGSRHFEVRALSGTQTSAVTAFSWTIDTSPPTVTPPIARTSSTPTNATALSWVVTFSESVTGVDTTDFQLANGGLTGPSITGVTGSGATYTVGASTGAGNGTLGLNLVDNDSIRDAAGNKLGGTGINNGNLTGQVYAVDKSAPPAPVFGTVPPDPSPTGDATFTWTDTETGVGFQCSYENGPWQSSCSTPDTFTVDDTNDGTHQFAVRAVDAAGNVSDSARYSWKISKLPFGISGDVGDLFPDQWTRIDVQVTNPYNFPIFITALSVAVSSSPSDCPASTNIEVQAAPLSSSHTIMVPMHGFAYLTGDDRPQIRLKDLPNTNQDDCKDAHFDLTYTGMATK